MTPKPRAAVLTAPCQPLIVKDVETLHPGANEVLIRNHTIAIQPLDAKMLISNYGPAASLNYPAVLGSSGAGVIEEVGSNVSSLQKGDRVVFDTKAYVDPSVNKQQGTWQQLVVCSAGTVAKIGTTPFEQAVLTSFPLQTAVAALHVFLGMGKPSTGSKKEKILIWGAGGAVGQYAVQYAASVGHTVIATASPHSIPSLLGLGASTVLDYRSTTILADLRAHGPFTYFLTCSGDALSQRTIIDLLSPTGGRFASVLPLSTGVELPANVDMVYAAFSQAAQKNEYAAWRNWWYRTYLPSMLASSAASPVAFTKVDGGLLALQKASQEVFDAKVRGKVIIDPQK
ncbi:hypothetical protein E8E12_005991 [Didymella heteroderae]|uniref:Enoyl reductase (ER) domain-containing protein n=1 Tax=Didymella heteroderae TaxID=1769908 RepID=A0A9P4WR41_9PLEO|nr:hypothetical protein E8E12_005991 [Didymella heteroderae]